MSSREHLPQSNVGVNVNGVYLEKALVERVYLNYANPVSLKYDMGIDLVDWLFIVGIYESMGKYYLLLEANDYSMVIDDMINNDVLPNMGIVSISKDDAIALTAKISKLGKEYFVYNMSYFQELMNLIVSSIDCGVRFTPLLNEDGYYDKTNNEIVVANNNSQIGMLWSLLHECVHFFLNSNRVSPCISLDYFLDKEEYVCNSVARRIITGIFGDIFEKADFKNLLGFLNKQEDFLAFKEDLMYIDNILKSKLFETDEDLQASINCLVERIEKILSLQKGENVKTDIDCGQTGLVKLSSNDNQRLYDIITSEISHMIPGEDDLDE